MNYLTCLKSFTIIAEQKSFAKAARIAGMHAPQLTKQIQWLEHFLNARLFERTTKITCLTEKGKIYYKHAQGILTAIDSARLAIDNASQEPQGKLILSSPISVNKAIFLSIITRFLNKYPGISFITKSINSPVSVIEGEANIAISNINCVDKQLVKHHILSCKRSLFASPKYIECYGMPTDVHQLEKHHCLLNTKDSPEKCWVLQNNKKLKINARYMSDAIDNIVYPAVKGLGIIWTTPLFIQKEIEEKKLIEVPIDVHWNPMHFYLYYRPVTRHSNIRLFVDYLIKYLVIPPSHTDIAFSRESA